MHVFIYVCMYAGICVCDLMYICMYVTYVFVWFVCVPYVCVSMYLSLNTHVSYLFFLY
jgi:hypothetical protein